VWEILGTGGEEMRVRRVGWLKSVVCKVYSQLEIVAVVAAAEAHKRRCFTTTIIVDVILKIPIRRESYFI